MKKRSLHSNDGGDTKSYKKSRYSSFSEKEEYSHRILYMSHGVRGNPGD